MPENIDKANMTARLQDYIDRNVYRYTQEAEPILLTQLINDVMEMIENETTNNSNVHNPSRAANCHRRPGRHRTG